MKIGCIISTPEIEHGPLALFSGPFEEKLKKAKSLGYDGVELMVREPSKLDIEEITTALNDVGLEVPQVVTGELFGIDGLALVHPDPTICKQAMSRTKDVINFASEFGSQTIVNIGRLRGRIDWLSAEDQEKATDIFAEAFQELSDFAQPLNVRITIEPCNRYEVDFIHNAQDALAVIQEVNRSNFGVMLDVFHMNIEDASIEQSLKELKPYLWHVHIADSNRLAPGQGHLDFESILNALREIGYSEYISAEMQPLPDPDTAARLTIEYIKPLL
jgi:5-keto-L-gluconate epimerase